MKPDASVAQSGPDHDPAMPLVDHLGELRHRLMMSVGAILAGFVICYSYAEPLFNTLLAPLQEILPTKGGNLIFTGLTEPFLVYLKTGLLGGVILAMPVIFLQIWLFVRPAFRGREEKYTTAFVFFGSFLFVVGAAFGYFLVFPFGFRFLIQFADPEFLPYLTIREYFSLTTKMLFAFGLMFETPLVLVFLARLGAIDAAWLRRNRRYAIVVIFVVGAILTPPDVVTQLMLAAPLMLLYELSIALVVIMGRPRPDTVPSEDLAAGSDAR